VLDAKAGVVGLLYVLDVKDSIECRIRPQKLSFWQIQTHSSQKSGREAWRVFKPSFKKQRRMQLVFRAEQECLCPPRNDNHTHWRLFSCYDAKADDYITKTQTHLRRLEPIPVSATLARHSVSVTWLHWCHVRWMIELSFSVPN